jgi:hypothetical protein
MEDGSEVKKAADNFSYSAGVFSAARYQYLQRNY